LSDPRPSRILRFYRELRRRRVFRVAAAYAVVGWVLVEVSATTFPHLNLPDWAVPLVIVLVALGFPVALVLAWAFDLTPDGIRRTALSSPRPAHASPDPRPGGVLPDPRPADASPDARPTAGPARPGDRRGRYEVRERLGVGAMGVVHRAFDTLLEREVALKFLPESMELDTEAARRFLQEARSAAALNHPNITTLHAIEDPDDRPFLVMELVEGETLEARLARAGRLAVEQAVAIAAQVAAGLDAAHGRGIVHRDIKPANLMLTPDGAVKVMDFGIARLPGGPARTRAGSTLGSAAYMSPEQVRGEGVDGRADVWSLGVVLYEMLTGALPFVGDNEHTVLHGVLHVDPEPLSRVRPDTPPWLADLVSAMMARERADRPASAGDVLAALRRGAAPAPGAAADAAPGARVHTAPPRQPLGPFRALPGPARVALGAAAVVLLLLPAAWMYRRDAVLAHARQVELPALLALVDAQDCLGAMVRWEALHPRLPDDRLLHEARDRCTMPVTLLSEPEGAAFRMRRYGDPDSEWLDLGTTPLLERRVPAGHFHWRADMPGYEPLEGALPTWIADRLAVTLVPAGEGPPGMVPVAAGDVTVGGSDARVEPFWIDRHEVTNAEYLEFVRAGGYREPRWWAEPFAAAPVDGPTPDPANRFRDATGQPGPATWELGVYPEGLDDHPVSGVSWYEAAAYCAWAGKRLPTVYHWKLAAGSDGSAENALYSDILWASNFDGASTAPVGSHPGISRHGAYDMAGNVKEWTWNEADGRRYILGGAWDEPRYMFTDLDAQPPLDRQPNYGFRCARFEDPDQPIVTAPMIPASASVFTGDPVPDEAFSLLLRPYAYDPTPLDPRLEESDDASPHWRRETVSLAAAYGGERFMVHIYFPRNAEPPWQSVLYYPSAAATRQSTSRGADVNYMFFVPRSGRVLVHPVLQGTYERRLPPAGPQAARDAMIQRVKDVRRTLDYLLTRDDLDPTAIAYLGISWGANHGPIVTAVEDRFAASILVSGGLRATPTLPEVDQPSFAPRVRVPTLMINGRHDFMNPVETHLRPLFDLLGTAAPDKDLRILESGHVPDTRDIIRESNAWLDRYLGPVRPGR
jgi:eukaryotic-like serine/threonine-protein kinase